MDLFNFIVWNNVLNTLDISIILANVMFMKIKKLDPKNVFLRKYKISKYEIFLI